MNVSGDTKRLTMHNINDLSEEVSRARTKHPGSRLLFEALMEEVCELLNAALEGKPVEEIQKEALQVACVAMRIREEGSRIEAEWMLRRLAMYEDALRDFLRSRGTPD